MLCFQTKRLARCECELLWPFKSIAPFFFFSDWHSTRPAQAAGSREKLTPCRHADIYLWSVKDQRACCRVFLTPECRSVNSQSVPAPPSPIYIHIVILIWRQCNVCTFNILHPVNPFLSSPPRCVSLFFAPDSQLTPLFLSSLPSFFWFILFFSSLPSFFSQFIFHPLP